MRVITIRAIAGNGLICFGPDNGMYDPGFNPAVAMKQVEPDYDAVRAEWAGRTLPPDPRQAAFSAALASPAIPQVLKDVLTVLKGN